MPQYAGLLLENGKFCGPLYRVTMQLAPDKFGISRDATNEEMLTGFLECINKQTKAAIAAARAEGEAAGAARERAAVADYLREQAEEDRDPWILHLADDVAAGQHWGVEAAMREADAAQGGGAA